MIFKQQKLEGVFIIEAESHSDERGLFRRHFCQNELRTNGIDFSVKQGNISENKKKHTLRGFHYQKIPSNESKIISCISGSIFNVLIDLRPNSTTFMQWQEFNFTSESRDSLYIPVGCANAFLTLEDNTWIHYYMNDFFSTDSLGFRHDDSNFNIKWPVVPRFLSDKDQNYPELKVNDL
jgi:dTDP-4-dehydrorhamnose 3,5-epimerase